MYVPSFTDFCLISNRFFICKLSGIVSKEFTTYDLRHIAHLIFFLPFAYSVATMFRKQGSRQNVCWHRNTFGCLIWSRQTGHSKSLSTSSCNRFAAILEAEFDAISRKPSINGWRCRIITSRQKVKMLSKRVINKRCSISRGAGAGFIALVSAW